MTNQSAEMNRRSFLRYSAVLGTGLVIGAAVRTNPSVNRLAIAASPESVDMTATREAELNELADLRTQVANPPVCTPAPTETPIPPTATATIVPPIEAGQPVPYQGIWTITVLSIAPVVSTTAVPAQGKFMQVNLTAGHSAADSEPFPHPDLRLVDDQGRLSVIDQAVNREILGNGWLFSIEPGVTENRALIFDVALDAGATFILESKSDPLFRVSVAIEQRG